MTLVHAPGLPPVQLHTRFDGDATAPPLLLINSLGTDLTMWDEQVAAWSATHWLLRYDQRGHGASSHPPGPYTIDRFGADALAIMDAAEVERADVCGLSLGGLVALWLAVHAPERVRRAVLASTAARIGSEGAWRSRASTVRDQGIAAVVDGVLQRFFSPGFYVSGVPAVARVEAGLRSGHAEGYAASCDALAVADLRGVAGGVVAPCLVVVGTRDAATPPADARDLWARLPHADYRELPGVGHLANLEQPQAFAALVSDFLTDRRTDPTSPGGAHRA